jgi:hypothetical protein
MGVQTRSVHKRIAVYKQGWALVRRAVVVDKNVKVSTAWSSCLDGVNKFERPLGVG